MNSIDFSNPNILNSLSLLGNFQEEEAKKKGINLDEVFKKCMKDAESIKDPIERLNTAMANYTLEMLKTMPLENRCIFVLNKLNKAMLDKVDENEIDWRKINEILFKNLLKYDYNLCDSVHTTEELTKLLMDIRESYIFGGAWYKQTCKTCGVTFYLSKDELNFYERKELHVPKRCKNCIIESKGQESPRQAKIREEKEREKIRKSLLPEDNRTSMQIAFDKAKKKG